MGGVEKIDEALSMRILVTNDDGIHAPGLEVLRDASPAHSADDVWVVAPADRQSGAAHSLSLADPLRCRKLAERRFAVAGTPTDCVMMAVRKILPTACPTSCCRASTAARTSPRTSPIPAPSPARWKATLLGFRPSRCRQVTGIHGNGFSYEVAAQVWHRRS